MHLLEVGVHVREFIDGLTMNDEDSSHLLTPCFFRHDDERSNVYHTEAEDYLTVVWLR